MNFSKTPESFNSFPDTSSPYSLKPPDKHNFNLKDEVVAAVASVAAIGFGTIFLGERIDAYIHMIDEPVREYLSFNALALAGGAWTIARAVRDRIQHHASPPTQ